MHVAHIGRLASDAKRWEARAWTSLQQTCRFVADAGQSVEPRSTGLIKHASSPRWRRAVGVRLAVCLIVSLACHMMPTDAFAQCVHPDSGRDPNEKRIDNVVERASEMFARLDAGDQVGAAEVWMGLMADWVAAQGPGRADATFGDLISGKDNVRLLAALYAMGQRFIADLQIAANDDDVHVGAAVGTRIRQLCYLMRRTSPIYARVAAGLLSECHRIEMKWLTGED